MIKFIIIILLFKLICCFNFTQKLLITNFISKKIIFLEELKLNLLIKNKSIIKYVSNNNYLNIEQKKFLILNMFYLIKEGERFSNYIIKNTYNFLDYFIK